LLILACRLSTESKQCKKQRKRRAAGVYHLAIGEERHIGDGAEAGMHVPAVAVAHLRPEHGLGDVPRVVVVPRAAVLQAELALQVVDAVLLLVTRDTIMNDVGIAIDVSSLVVTAAAAASFFT
jgi:hypothetical protein